jgi:hypothetical protein
MKKILLLFAVFIIAFSQSCKKDSTAETKLAVADIPLNARDMRMAGDSISTDLPDSSILILKADYTWTLDVQGAKSFGTYTWAPIELYRTQIKFIINQWTQFGTDPAKSNKLKNILLTVDKCEFPGTTITGVYFSAQNVTTSLRTLKQ